MEIRLEVGRAPGRVYGAGGGREEDQGNLAKPQCRTEASTKILLYTVREAPFHSHES